MRPIHEFTVVSQIPESLTTLSDLAATLHWAWDRELAAVFDRLGAFIGGLVVSSGKHRHRAQSYVAPFQMVFTAIFLASIGMLLNLGFVFDNLVLVGLLAGFSLLVKFSPSRSVPERSDSHQRKQSLLRVCSPRSASFHSSSRKWALTQGSAWLVKAPPATRH